MTVEDTFLVKGIGLLLSPSFEVSNSAKWERITEDLVVQNPERQEFVVSGLFELAHFNIRDPDVPGSERWKIQLVLQDVSPEFVPIGSVIFSTQETKNAVMGTGIAPTQ